MNELTIITYKWRGWRGDNFYKAEHVNTLKRMVADNCSIPHRFVCITDDPTDVEAETRAMTPDPGIQVMGRRPNSFRRLWLFSEEAREEFGPRILHMDLDCVILKDIAPLLTDDWYKVMYGKASRYNGSMWQVKPGVRPEIWTGLHCGADAEIRKYNHRTKLPNYGSDQAWMSYKIEDAPTWGKAEGCFHFSLLYPDGYAPGSRAAHTCKNFGRISRVTKLPDHARIVFFAGSQKPWSPETATRSPKLYAAYQKYVNPTTG